MRLQARRMSSISEYQAEGQERKDEAKDKKRKTGDIFVVRICRLLRPEHLFQIIIFISMQQLG